MQMTAQPPKIYRTAGENATWDFANGVFSPFPVEEITNISTDENDRFPVSSTQGGYSFWSGTAWRVHEKSGKKNSYKIGITSISENAFNYLPNLKEVVIENGVHTVERKLFLLSALILKQSLCQTA